MAQALTRFSEQSNLRILFPFEGVQAMRSRAVKGRLDDREALERLIAGTALRIASMRDNVVVLSLPRSAGAVSAGAAPGDTDNLPVSPRHGLSRPITAQGGPAPANRSSSPASGFPTAVRRWAADTPRRPLA